MPQVPPKKPVKLTRKLPPGHRARSVEEETAGKIYLVRDKDYGDGHPVLWGRDLFFADAQQLKELVAARRLSNTVRYEEQIADSTCLTLPIDPRSPWAPPLAVSMVPGTTLVADPSLAAAQTLALGAASGMAADANRRHAELKARKEAEQAAAAIKPLPMPEIPSMEEIDAGEIAGIDPDELEKLMAGGDLPDADDLAAAAAELDGDKPAPVNLLDLALTRPCEHEGCGATPGAPCKDASGPITHPERIAAAHAAVEPDCCPKCGGDITEEEGYLLCKAPGACTWAMEIDAAPEGG